MQTAIYLRISQDHTGEHRSVKGQREDCYGLAEQLGWTVYEEYRDEDKSATSGKLRPNYERMLTDIEAGKVGAIIAWHTDRLYRTTRDLDPLIDILETHGVEIRTVKSGQFDLGTPTGRGIARILASVAQMEVEHKADRWERSVKLRREDGHMPKPGGAVIRMFGWTPSGELVQEEKEVACWMAEQIIAGRTLVSLCAELDERGVSTVTGKPWRPTVLRGYMTNPRLAGYATLRGEIMGRGDWDPILPEQVWQTVRSLLAARSRSAAPRVALLAGMIYCGTCEQPMTTGGVGRKGQRLRTYRCWARPGFPQCGKVSAVADPVEAVVEGVAKGLLSRSEVRQWLAKARAGGQEHVLTELDAQEQRFDEIANAIADGSLSAVVGGQAEAVVRKRIEALEAQLASTAPVRIPKDVEVTWPADLGSRRRLVELVVDRVWVDPAKVRGGRFDPRRVRVDPADAVRRIGG